MSSAAWAQSSALKRAEREAGTGRGEGAGVFIAAFNHTHEHAAVRLLQCIIFFC
jgi:hypothetical protein